MSADSSSAAATDSGAAAAAATASSPLPSVEIPKNFSSATIVVTGSTGFIGSHIVKLLLEHGHTVRATCRDDNKVGFLKKLEKSEKVKEAGGALSLHKADLMVMGDFDTVCEGADFVVHTAAVVKNEAKDPMAEVVAPGVLGAENIARAVNKNIATVKRVIFTSSVAAIIQPENERLPQHRGKPFTDEEVRADSRASYCCYEAEKTLSERALIFSCLVPVVAICPSLVVGPLLSPAQVSSSMQVIKLLATREYPVAPLLYTAQVDVRDVARAHYLAMFTQLPGGERCRIQRFICSLPSMKPLSELSPIINKEFPHLNAPTASTPLFVLKTMKLIDSRITPMVVTEYAAPKPDFDNSKIQQQLNGFNRFEFTELSVMLKDGVQSLIDLGIAAKPPVAK